MMIIGCDLHTRYQQIAMVNTETGDVMERRSEHESAEARAFYGALQGRVRVGIEATGYTHWFEQQRTSKCSAGIPRLSRFGTGKSTLAKCRLTHSTA